MTSAQGVAKNQLVFSKPWTRNSVSAGAPSVLSAFLSNELAPGGSRVTDFVNVLTQATVKDGKGKDGGHTL